MIVWQYDDRRDQTSRMQEGAQASYGMSKQGFRGYDMKYKIKLVVQ